MTVERNSTTINPPVVIFLVKPTELHTYWPFLERGLKDIHRKVEPDWIPPDVYGALRAEAATAAIASRDHRWLGFAIYHRQERPWSHKSDLFIWCLWNIPLRERLPTDDVPEAMQRGIQYLKEVQRMMGAERMVSITSRRSIVQRYGKRELFITYEI